MYISKDCRGLLKIYSEIFKCDAKQEIVASDFGEVKLCQPFRA